MKKPFIIIGLIGALLFSGTIFISCKKEPIEVSDLPISIEDGIPAEFDSLIGAYSVDLPPFNELSGPDGTPMEKSASWNIIHDMTEYGINLAEQKNTVIHPEEPSEPGYTSPEHKGYAYSYGQRDMTRRLPPTQGNDLHKSYKVYGTDCSGFMINLFSNVGIELDRNFTNVEVFESKLKEAIKTANQKIIVQNLSKPPIDKIIAGDIIRWYVPKLKIAHMGIVFVKGDIKYVCQCNGYSSPSTEEKQKENLDKRHGVHAFLLSNMISNGWGSDYNVLRLKSVGDTAYGGIIFYIDDTREHGLVCAKEVIDLGMWDGDCLAPDNQYIPIETGAISTSIGAGKSNSDIIVNVLGTNNAAYSCKQYRGGDKLDWFLPSKDELNELFKQFNSIDGLSPGVYWSSSEYTMDILGVPVQVAYSQNIANGTYTEYSYKSNSHNILPVRAF